MKLKAWPKNLLEIQWEREEKKEEMQRPPEADFRGIYSDPVLKARMIAELEAIYADSSNDLDPKDLAAIMNLWNETGAKILPRQQQKSSLAWKIADSDGDSFCRRGWK